MDNGASFIGDLIHSRHFSRVMKLCLHPGVEPVFIAPGKPWMSGTIEDFNGDFGEKLWEREQWTDPEHIRKEAKTFLMRHNNRQDRKTDPEAIPHRRLPEDFEIGADSLLITEGKVHFIRQVKGEEAGLIEIYGYKIGENVKRFEEKF